MLRLTCTAMLVGVSSAAINFIGMGDFGGSGSQTNCERFTTLGQCSTAVTLNVIAKKVDATFLIGPGDLIYSDGLDKSGSEKTDQRLRMENTFEKVYSAERCPNLQIPWYVVAGNHDHHGDVALEIQWHHESPSGRWRFPSEYYAIHEVDSETGATLDIFMIDTELISGVEFYNTTYPDGKPYKTKPADKKLADQQLEWLEDQLKRSAAHYVWISGHYPVYSTCAHGGTWGNMEPVYQLMKQYKVTGMIAGHDHCLVDIQYDGLYHIVTGMGGRSVYPHDRPDYAPPGSEKWHLAGDNNGKALGGFITASFTRQYGSISFWTDVDPETGVMSEEPLHVIEGIQPRY